MEVFVIANLQGTLPQSSYVISPYLLMSSFFLHYRDSFIYAASIESDAVDVAVKILGDVVLRPRLTPIEVHSLIERLITQ